MNNPGTKLVAALALVSGLALPVLSGQRPYTVAGESREIYYGHVSFVDLKNDGLDPVILREGAEKPEIARLNAPLGPGDVVRTSEARRLEVQFDNGTILRLDTGTEVKIETILAQSLSSRQQISNLVLRRGRVYAMYKHYGNLETFQVLTPEAAVKLNHGTVAMIGLTAEGGTDVQVKYGKATLRYGPDQASLRDLAVKKNERMTIGADHRFALQDYEENTDFELWNKAINEDFVALHEGQSYLPAEIKRINPAVWEFAQKFGSVYGEWFYDRMFGYVWRPFYNDVYPWGSWQPYFYGHWTGSMGSLFWIPDEPWGWVPYHLGVWHWNSKRGWFWIPGSAFAPAWVDWAFYFGGYWAWRPMGFWNWWWQDNLLMNAMYYGWGYMPSSFYDFYFYMQSYGGMSYYGYGPGTGPGMISAVTKVTKDQLRSRPAAPRLGIAKEFEKAFLAFRAAVAQGDPETLASLDGPGRSFMVLAASDFSATDLKGKIVPGEAFLAARESVAPNAAYRLALGLPVQRGSLAARSAAQAFRRLANVRPAGAEPLSVRALPPATRLSLPAAATRFRDFNPDIKAARALGVTIRYASVRNEIVCPERGISSSSVVSRTTSMLGGGYLGRSFGGVGTGSGAAASVSSGGGSASSGGSAAGGAASSASSGSSGSSGSSSGSVAGGGIKR